MRTQNPGPLEWSISEQVVNASLQIEKVGVPGVIHVCTGISIDLLSFAGFQYGTWYLVDGAGGTTLMEGTLGANNTTVPSDKKELTGLNIPGTAGNGMYLVFQGTATTVDITATLVGYDL